MLICIRATKVLKSTDLLRIKYCCYVWSGASEMYLEFLNKIRRRMCNFITVDLRRWESDWMHHAFSHFPVAVTKLVYTFSINIYTVNVLISFHPWYLQFANLNATPNWQLGFLILQLKLLDATICSTPTASYLFSRTSRL